MHKNNKFKAIVAIAIAMTFIISEASMFADIVKSIENEINEINDIDGMDIPVFSMARSSIGEISEEIDWWPMFHHDPIHNGYSMSTAPDTNDVLWKYTTDDDVRSSPAVADEATFDPGDILFNYNVERPSGDNQCLGVEFDGTYFYITGGGGSGGPEINKIHFFQPDDNPGSAPEYIASIDQGTTSQWGWRDIGYDGNHMYSGDEDGLVEWYVTGLPDNPVLNKVGTIPGPLSVCRAMAYDPSTDHFWTANWDSNICEFERNGNIVNSYFNNYSVYGMSFDAVSPGGPWLWVFSQNGSGLQISQFDPINGVYTGVTYSGYGSGIAGGACFIEYWEGKGVFVGLNQADPEYIYDSIFGMEMCIGNPPPETPELPVGPSSGVVEVEYTFYTSTTDPEGEQIYYMWDWGDGVVSDWIGPYDSGANAQANHTWTEEGDYNITVKAKDVVGSESEWSYPKAIHIIGPPILEIGNITGGLFKVSAVIKNTGSVDATMVNWSIVLDGGFILLGKETTGDILSIPAGDESMINSSLIFGFGNTVVTVCAEIPESSAMKEQDAFVLLFFIKIIDV